jgi:hypothetical protein
MPKPVNLVFIYIYLAVASALLGMVITFTLLLVCQYFNIDLFIHWWLLAIPVVLAVSVNIVLIELYKKHRSR